MIRLPKKIEETIKRELTENYSVIKRVFIDSPYKNTKLHLIMIRTDCRRYHIVRYWGDHTFCIIGGFTNREEAQCELKYQVVKISGL